MGCGSSTAGSDMRAQQQAQQKNINQGLTQINQAFQGFNPDFYKGIQNAYSNFAMPQLYSQYQPMANQLGYKLANQGLMGSSTDAYLHNQLGQQMGLAQQTIGNQGIQESRNLQQQVGNEKANLINQLQTSADPQSIAMQATGAASQFNAPSAFAPIGNLLNQFGQLYLGSQAANTYNQFANQYLSGYNNPAIYSSGAIPKPGY